MKTSGPAWWLLFIYVDGPFLNGALGFGFVLARLSLLLMATAKCVCCLIDSGVHLRRECQYFRPLRTPLFVVEHTED